MFPAAPRPTYGVGGQGPNTGNLTSGVGTGYNAIGPMTPTQKQYGLYGAAVDTQAKDYDTLMQGYQGILAKTNRPAAQISANTGQWSPTGYTYNETPEQKAALSNLSNLSQTGGYSSQDIADLRARGVSPIRAAYSAAQRNIDRNRSIQGGYSPNYAAIQAKMAREQSQSMADATNDINARIAQNVAANKLGIAPQFMGAASDVSGAINKASQMTTEEQNKAAESNAARQLSITQGNIGLNRQSIEDALAALSGARSLYGTTPALTSTFGSQALQTAGLQNQMQQEQRRNAIAALRG